MGHTHRDLLRRLLPAAALVTLALTAAVTAQAPATQKRIRFTIAEETTRVIEPVRADGTIDYVAAADRERFKGVAPEENSAIPIVTIIGPQALTAATRAQVIARLGIKDPAPGPTFATFKKWLGEQSGKEAAKLGQANDMLGTAGEAAWRAEDLPELAKWIDQQSPALDAAAEAAKRPKWAFPAITDNASGSYIAMSGPPLPEIVALGQAFVIRAMRRLEPADTADRNKVWSDLAAAQRLARHISRGGPIVDRVAAYQISHMAWRGSIELLRDEGAPADAYRAMLKELDAMAPMGTIAESLEKGERYVGLDAVMMAIRSAGGGGSGAKHEKEAAVIALADVNWDLILRDMNAYYDEALKAARAPTHADRTQKIADFEAMARALKRDTPEEKESLATRLSVTLRAFASPPLSAGVGQYEATRQELDLLRVGLALAAAKARHKKYPADLASLAPDFIPAIPKDRYSGAPLVYRTTTRGYVLYSIGADAKDDDGRDLARGKGDIVLKVRGR